MSIRDAKSQLSSALVAKKAAKLINKPIVTENYDKIVEKIAQEVEKPPVPTLKSSDKPKQKHSLNGKLLHIKVGGKDWEEGLVAIEIEKIQEQIGRLFEDNGVDCLVFVTHY